jgi:HEPN domain-containing protein
VANAHPASDEFMQPESENPMEQKIIDNWLSLAQYDLDTAEAMLRAERYLYVGFMCQQAIEKVLKASYVKHHASTPPYTHNLLRLIAELPWKADMNRQAMEVMERLNSYYIESRYTRTFRNWLRR